MKRILLTLWTVVIALTGLTALEISSNDAKTVATNYYKATDRGIELNGQFTVNLVHTEVFKSLHGKLIETPRPVYYIFNINENDGFIIVSGDDAAKPVLAYGTVKGFPYQKTMPAHVSKWYEGYKNEMRFLIENNISADNATEQEWNLLIRQERVAFGERDAVSPLMTTTWDQGSYYYDQCPYDYTYNARAVTGCVATALAQVMKYHDYPTQGTGSHSYNTENYGTLSANFGSTTYNWSSMTNNVTSANSAVAQLMSHCGIAVEMNYSPQSSGAYVAYVQSPITHCTEHALKTYFGYDSDLEGVNRSSYSDAAWVSLLKTELLASRPVLYAGVGNQGGHAFVFDGFDIDDYFHVNWGWSGNSDGYFWVSALNPSALGTGGGSGGFNSYQHAIIGVKPPADSGGGGGGGSTEEIELTLNAPISINPTTVTWGGDYTISTNVLNSGTESFTGGIACYLFDSEDNYVAQIGDVISVSDGLPSGYTFSNPLTFSVTGNQVMPGDYKVIIYYLHTNQTAAVVAASDGNNQNVQDLTIIHSQNIEMYSDFSLSTAPEQNAALTVAVDVANFDQNASWTGTLALDIFGIDYSYIGTIEEQVVTINEYSYDSYTFSTTNLDFEPGTYLLFLTEFDDTDNYWDAVGSTNYENPIKITIAKPGDDADQYEVNDTENQAYAASLSFAGNTASFVTDGTNMHNTNDVDYFKIDLPAGYDYTFNTRLNDSYSSENNDLTFTNDVMVAYRSSLNSDYSDAYDSELFNNVVFEGGQTLYFGISSYFNGTKGTYEFDVQINRQSVSSVNDLTAHTDINVFPSPADEQLNVRFDEKTVSGKVQLLNTLGQNVIEQDFNQQTLLHLDISNLASGTYLLNITSDLGSYSQKVMVE